MSRDREGHVRNRNYRKIRVRESGRFIIIFLFIIMPVKNVFVHFNSPCLLPFIVFYFIVTQCKPMISSVVTV